MKHSDSERGASAVLIAASMVFLIGAAALAVDTAGFYVDARTDQTTADLACLSGAAELPDTAAAIAAAAEVTTLNWPEKSLSAPTIVGTVGTMTDGAGNIVTIDAQYKGNSDQMSVTVSERSETDFAAVLGATSVNVTQTAVCEAEQATSGKGIMPIGALGGGFDGDLFDCARKVTGNCGALAPVGSGANVWRDALENGVDANVQKHHGNWTALDPHSGNPGTECVNAGDTCNAFDTEPGNMSGPFNQGIANLLSDVSNAGCVQNGNFNCDSMSQVLGGTAETLASKWPTAPPADFAGFVQPSGWEPSLYGPYASAKNNQYYYNGTGIKCDSPRLATIPIVDYDKNNSNDWDLGDPNSSWPGGRKMMKVIGFYTVYIREPANYTDVGNGGANGLGQVVSDVIWFGPDAKCEDGSTFAPIGSFNVYSGVKLIAG